MRSIELFPITLRRLEVARGDLSPGMRRITFTGAALDAHVTANGIAVPAFESKGFDDDVKLFLQHPDLGEPVLPVQHDGVIVWPGHDKLIARTYTDAPLGPRRCELDVDFVLHAHGHATCWAASQARRRDARPGRTNEPAGRCRLGADRCRRDGAPGGRPLAGGVACRAAPRCSSRSPTTPTA